MFGCPLCEPTNSYTVNTQTPAIYVDPPTLHCWNSATKGYIVQGWEIRRWGSRMRRHTVYVRWSHGQAAVPKHSFRKDSYYSQIFSNVFAALRDCLVNVLGGCTPSIKRPSIVDQRDGSFVYRRSNALRYRSNNQNTVYW